MNALILRCQILLASFRLEVDRYRLYRAAKAVTKHHMRIRALRSRLASIDCPQRAFKVVVARKIAR